MQSQTEVASPVGESSGGGGGRLSRWFSMRRGSAHQYDLGSEDCRTTTGNVNKENKLLASKMGPANCTGGIQMPQLTEVRSVCLCSWLRGI